MRYTVMQVQRRPGLAEGWEGDGWCGVPHLRVDRFRPESSPHRPSTALRLVCDAEGIAGIFRVGDRFVRCRRTGFQDAVYRDSCVECFVAPVAGSGYFNFEFNCGGAMLASWVTDPTRTDHGLKGFRPLTLADCQRVGIRSSLPAVVDPEIPDALVWTLSFFIPIALLEAYAGPVDPSPGSIWRGNFFKCADDSSHPHWASWSPVDALNFHLPRCFGELHFGGPPGGSALQDRVPGGESPD